jgi:hypothetical protein
MSIETTANSWQSKRIDAINRKIKRSRSARAMTEAYIDEYDRVYKSKCKTKTEYKKWIQENGKV